jgi:hypothetical protein
LSIGYCGHTQADDAKNQFGHKNPPLSLEDLVIFTGAAGDSTASN